MPIETAWRRQTASRERRHLEREGIETADGREHLESDGMETATGMETADSIKKADSIERRHPADSIERDGIKTAWRHEPVAQLLVGQLMHRL
jgi:hypothetical protein